VALLAVEGLSLAFRGLRALNGIGLAIGAGETLGIIGPNGSGKSTLFNVISGIYAPDAGQVRLREQPIAGRDPRAIAALGIARTYQNKRLFRSLTVAENVEVAALRAEAGGWVGDILGRAAARAGRAAAGRAALAALEAVGLAALAGQPAASLSYGQQNRLEIARALALAPALLLLDEPAAGLNPAERADMRGLIAAIAARGITVMLVEHDMRLVMQLCSRIVALDHGEVIAEGPPERVARDRAVIAAYFGAGQAADAD
jgi:branched-chain amino acid transport system ATP-binding protein